VVSNCTCPILCCCAVCGNRFLGIMHHTRKGIPLTETSSKGKFSELTKEQKIEVLKRKFSQLSEAEFYQNERKKYNHLKIHNISFQIK